METKPARIRIHHSTPLHRSCPRIHRPWQSQSMHVSSDALTSPTDSRASRRGGTAFCPASPVSIYIDLTHIIHGLFLRCTSIPTRRATCAKLQHITDGKPTSILLRKPLDDRSCGNHEVKSVFLLHPSSSRSHHSPAPNPLVMRPMNSLHQHRLPLSSFLLLIEGHGSSSRRRRHRRWRWAMRSTVKPLDKLIISVALTLSSSSVESSSS